jgi:hypothetical protein
MAVAYSSHLRRPGRGGLAGCAAVAAVATALLTSCGTVTSSSSQSHAGPMTPVAAVSAALSSTTTVKTMTFTALLTTGSQSGHVTGSIETGTPLRADLTVQVAGQNVEERIVGSTIYLKVPALAKKLGKPWASVSMAAIGKAAGLNLAQLMQQVQQASPGQSLDMLSKSAHITSVGPATVDGASTTHYAGVVDLAAALSRFSPQLQVQIKALTAKLGVKSVHIDLWLTPNHLPKRITQTYTTIAGPESIQVDYTSFNRPVTVQAPPANQTVNLDSLLNKAGL